MTANNAHFWKSPSLTAMPICVPFALKRDEGIQLDRGGTGFQWESART